MNLSTVKWAQWDKTQSREVLVCSYVCASQCAQLLHTILHRTDLIVFPLTLQTITTTLMMSIWGKGGASNKKVKPIWILMKLDDGVAVALAGSYAKHLHIIIMVTLCTLCSKKLDHQAHGGNLVKSQPIFKILLLLDSVIICSTVIAKDPTTP